MCDDSDSDDEGWGALAAHEAAHSANAVSATHSALDSDHEEEGWAFAIDGLDPAGNDDRFLLQTPAASNKSGPVTSSQRKRGRPAGIKGSHEYRRMLKEGIQKESGNRVDAATRAREAKLKKKWEDRLMTQGNLQTAVLWFWWTPFPV